MPFIKNLPGESRIDWSIPEAFYLARDHQLVAYVSELWRQMKLQMSENAEELELYRRSHDFRYPPAGDPLRQKHRARLGISAKQFEELRWQISAALPNVEPLMINLYARFGAILLGKRPTVKADFDVEDIGTEEIFCTPRGLSVLESVFGSLVATVPVLAGKMAERGHEPRRATLAMAQTIPPRCGFSPPRFNCAPSRVVLWEWLHPGNVE